MTAAVSDIYFLNIEDAYAEAAKQQQVVDADGKQRLQYCYYDGPLTDIPLENFICVEQDRFVEFFSHNHLPLPQLLGLSNAGQVIFNAMPDDVLQEIRQQRAGYKIGGYIHFDTYFVDPLKALNVAKQNNRVDCRHPTIDGLQICYYRGELPQHDIANLVHLELEQFEDFFIRSRLRIPENLEFPEELEAEIKAAVRDDLNRLIAEVKNKRNWLGHRLFAKAKAQAPRRLPGEKPRIFVPANRLTTVMQYSSRGIANAFSAMGWEVLFYIEANDMEGVNLVDMLEKYIDFAPHACFQVNTLNNAFIHGDIVNLLWWQDLMQLRHRQPINWRDKDFCFSISPVFDEYLQVCKAHTIERLHFVIDDQVFNSRAAVERENKVVFVGSSYLPVVNFDNPQHRQTVEQLLSRMRAGGRFDRQTIAEIAAANGLDDDFVFWKLLHYVIRDHAVKWLCAAQGSASVAGGRMPEATEELSLPVEVYGRFWDQDPEVAAYFRGELPHGEAVADVYRRSRYALVCHPFEINSQRLAEVAACGCIPLVYDCRDVAEGPFWEDYCLFFKTADQLKQILQQGLQPRLPPEGLAANFTYRHAGEKVAEFCGLNRLPLQPAELCGGTLSLMAESYGDRLRLQSHDTALLQRCQDNLRRNLHSLSQHRPVIHQFLLEAWNRQNCLIELDRDIAGQPWRVAIWQNDQASYRLDNMSCLEHKLMIAENAAKLKRENTCCYGLVGLGAGYELLEVFSATANPIPEMAEFEVAIYLLEADPLFWLVNLLLHDWQPLLSEKRLQIFHQADCWSLLDEQFARFEVPLPDILFSLNPAKQADAVRLFETVEQAKQSREQRHQRNLQQVADYYAAIDLGQWRQKFSPENRGQLRVMGFISRFTSFLKYCMRDWLDGFERLGATTLTCTESKNHDLSNIEQLIDEINRFKPDLILGIDHFRHEYQGIPPSVPFVNWIQDMMPGILNNQTAPASRDFTCVVAEDWLGLNQFPAYAKHDIYFLPLGYNDNIYFPLPGDKEYSCDILMVTHLLEPELTLEPFRRPELFDFKLDGFETGLVNDGKLSKEQLFDIYSILARHLQTLNMHEFHEFCSLLDERANFQLFEHVLKPHGFILDDDTVIGLLRNRLHNEFLSHMKTWPIRLLLDSGIDCRIHVYGRNWNQYPQFVPLYKGIAENGEFLNRIMNQAKICLNASPGMTLHMRALEIIAAKAFMLSRDMYYDSSKISAYFSDDQIVLYKDEADFIAKIVHYLAADDERTAIAERALIAARQKFSYTALASSLLQLAHNRISGQSTADFKLV